MVVAVVEVVALVLALELRGVYDDMFRSGEEEWGAKCLEDD